MPISETGTATIGTSVARASRRKTKTTRITSPMAIISVSCTSFSEARMVVDRSTITARSIAGGIEARRYGSSDFTRSTVAMMLALGER